MRKILSIILTLAMIISFAAFASPAAFADDGSGNSVSFSVAKHPTSETIKAGNKVIFKSYPQGVNHYSVYWTFEDTDGNVIEAENAPDKFPGLIVELPDIQRIRLRNTPDSMNGFKVQAHFVKDNGETIHSDYAFLYVEPNADFQPQTYTGSQSTNGNCENAPCGKSSCEKHPNQSCPKPAITKHPTDEVLLHDGQYATYFEARANNSCWMSWEFKIGDNGTPFSAEEASSEYGLNLEGYNSNQLWIYGITWGINGWYVRAVFYDCNNNPTYSKWAFMRLVKYVDPAPCKPCQPCQPQQPPCNPWVVDPYCSSPCVPYVHNYGWSETTVVTTTHTETDATTTSVYGYYYP